MNTEPIQPDSTSLERLRAGDRWREEQESSDAVSNLLAASKRWRAQEAQETADILADDDLMAALAEADADVDNGDLEDLAE